MTTLQENMQLNDMVIDNNKLIILNNALEDLCLSCAGIGILCNDCQSTATRKDLYKLALKNPETTFPFPREFERLTEFDNNLLFSGLLFNKNKVMIAQDAVEDICFNCAGAGILCFDCHIHQARRTLASLPVQEIAPKFSKKAKKESSAKSCGTSCSTGCGTKK